MKNKEMIEWASSDGELDLEKLIWIARSQERKWVWDYVKRLAEFEIDVATLESYPGGFKKGKK